MRTSLETAKAASEAHWQPLLHVLRPLLYGMGMENRVGKYEIR